MATLLCFSCHELHEIAYVDPIDRGYCFACTRDLPIGSVTRAMQFLSLTIPFTVGDRVAAFTAGELYDGIGTVTGVSFDHRVTPMYPTFGVHIDDPADDEVPENGKYIGAQLVRADRHAADLVSGQ